MRLKSWFSKNHKKYQFRTLWIFEICKRRETLVPNRSIFLLRKVRFLCFVTSFSILGRFQTTIFSGQKNEIWGPKSELQKHRKTSILRTSVSYSAVFDTKSVSRDRSRLEKDLSDQRSSLSSAQNELAAAIADYNMNSFVRVSLILLFRSFQQSSSEF